MIYDLAGSELTEPERLSHPHLDAADEAARWIVQRKL